jgi:hypothetical protein
LVQKVDRQEPRLLLHLWLEGLAAQQHQALARLSIPVAQVDR